MLLKDRRERFDLNQIDLELKIIEPKVKIVSENIHDGNSMIVNKICCNLI